MARNSKKPVSLTQAEEANRAALKNARARREVNKPARKERQAAHMAKTKAERNKPWTCGVCGRGTTGDMCQHCGSIKGSWVCSRRHANGPKTEHCDKSVVIHEGHYGYVCGLKKPTSDLNLSGAGGRTCSD